MKTHANVYAETYAHPVAGQSKHPLAPAHWGGCQLINLPFYVSLC